MRRTKDLEMRPGQSYEDNVYANTCDHDVQGMKDSPKAKAARSTQHRVILILVVLLILAFVALGILTSFLFTYYKSINGEMSKMKSSLSSDIQSILGAVNKQEKDIQNANSSLSGDIQSILGAVNKQDEDIQNANNSLSSKIQRILGVLEKVTEEVQKISSTNLACSTELEQYGLNCYYISSSKQSWNASKKDCQDREAHLMVINSEGEMNFLRRISKNIKEAWIGLTDADGTWRWVDGTPYDTTPKFWNKGQPDDWKGHGQAGGEGGEDCVSIINAENWHDSHCSLNFRYICEKKIF